MGKQITKFFRKTVITGVLMTLMATGFVACSSSAENKGEDSNMDTMNTQESGEATDEAGAETKPSDYNPNKPSNAGNNKPAKDKFVSDRSAVFEMFADMNVGWNLGNTFDAHGAGNSLRSETYWGNPKTTKEMIDAIKEEGFNTIRIPVTWAEHVSAAPDYTINEEWLTRVQEVVDYAVENDMYIILNTHHEPDFWMKPDADHKDAAREELVKIWEQIANRFKDYNQKLIFEGMNEPRTKGSANEWNGGTAEERKIINEWNQAFVDAVRATGGNNETRVLVICPYANSATYYSMKDLKIPEDNNIAVAVHLYTPYVFTYQAPEGNVDEWDGSKKGDITGVIGEVKTQFIKKDVPVIITEFGAVNKKHPEDVIKWLNDYMETTNRQGITCVWWDNGIHAGNGEKFAIFNRKDLTWFEKEIADTLVENAKNKQ